MAIWKRNKQPEAEPEPTVEEVRQQLHENVILGPIAQLPDGRVVPVAGGCKSLFIANQALKPGFGYGPEGAAAATLIHYAGAVKNRTQVVDGIITNAIGVPTEVEEALLSDDPSAFDATNFYAGGITRAQLLEKGARIYEEVLGGQARVSTIVEDMLSAGVALDEEKYGAFAGEGVSDMTLAELKDADEAKYNELVGAYKKYTEDAGIGNAIAQRGRMRATRTLGGDRAPKASTLEKQVIDELIA